MFHLRKKCVLLPQDRRTHRKNKFRCLPRQDEIIYGIKPPAVCGNSFIIAGFRRLSSKKHIFFPFFRKGRIAGPMAATRIPAPQPDRLPALWLSSQFILTLSIAYDILFMEIVAVTSTPLDRDTRGSLPLRPLCQLRQPARCGVCPVPAKAADFPAEASKSPESGKQPLCAARGACLHAGAGGGFPAAARPCGNGQCLPTGTARFPFPQRPSGLHAVLTTG